MINTEKLKTLAPGLRDALRAKSSILGKPLIGPKIVNIHIIQACDRKCAFCWYFSPLISTPPDRIMLDYAVLEGVIEDCHEIGVEEINLEGGEVVLYPHAEKLFKKIKELGMALRTYSHLDYDTKHLRYLYLADFINVNFSAFNEESYRRVHGKSSGSMANLLKHLDILLTARRKFGKPKIVLTFIAYKDNYCELPDLLELAHKRQVDKVFIYLFKATKEMRDLILSKDSLSRLLDILEAGIAAGYKFEHNLEDLRDILVNGQQNENINSLTPSSMHNDRLFTYDSTGGKSINCQVGWYYSFIDETGRVVAPCDSVGVCVAGNVNQRRYKDIWFNNDLLHSTLREASEGIQTCKSKWQECRYCTYRPVNKILNEQIDRMRS